MRNALESAVFAAGHDVAITDQVADLALVDTLHPPPVEPTNQSAILRLVMSANATAQDIACPVHPSLLIQRLLTHKKQSAHLPLGRGWQLNLHARTLEHPEHPQMSLTEKESLLLATLLKMPEAAVDRDLILDTVWGMDSNAETHTLETHIYRLRSKLDALAPSPGNIINDSNGYKLKLSH